MTFRWHFWIDRGGTFTDCIGLDTETREIRVAKLLSEDEAPIAAIRKVLRIPEGPLPACDVRLGTTVATNALLESKGAPTALMATEGLEDALAIGTQARPDLFQLHIDQPKPLYGAVVSTTARGAPDGKVLQRPDIESELAALKEVREQGFESLAILVLHGTRCPELEEELAELGRSAGFDQITMSHRVLDQRGYCARGDTTVADAYLTPKLNRYIQMIGEELTGGRLRLMQSSGGLVEAGHFRGKDAVLSGPAGGVVAVGQVARACGFAQAIGLDMGGTSSDVCRWAGEPAQVYEQQVASVRIRATMMDIHTVAAGGGSVCRPLHQRLVVGPDSVGSQPGPLCYGRPEADQISLTDVMVALGRVVPDRFPFPLDPTRSNDALQKQAKKLKFASREELADGYFEVACSAMTEAIRRVTVSRGFDVREHALVAFGGAAGQVACRLSKMLGIRDVLVHPLAGVMSAFGIGLADVTWDGVRDAQHPDPDAPQQQSSFSDLEAQGREVLRAQGFDAPELQRRIDLRYRGTETVLTLPWGEDPRSAFEAAHRRRFGYLRPDHPVEAVALRVRAVGRSSVPEVSSPTPGPARAPRMEGLYADGVLQRVPVMDRASLPVGRPFPGPCILAEETTTVVVEPDFTVERRPDEILHLRGPGRVHDPGIPAREFSEPDPVRLETLGHRFMSIAEQMGSVLQNTALSTNIRERMDFSCALFDGDGRLVANAPHIPVHLGAMSETVAAVLRAHPNPEDGQVFVSNDPYAGGSHLPDITVMASVEAEGERFFVASRGHHADVGGITPGSMPPFSQTLEEEGVVFRNLLAVKDGVFRKEAVEAILASGPFPARNPSENLADLEAQVAACRAGAQALLELTQSLGAAGVRAYMDHLRAHAADLVRARIKSLPKEASFRDRMDDGTPICVQLVRSDSGLRIDFGGTGPAVNSNLNAPPAVTVAAVLYVLRCMLGPGLPLNHGCLEPIELEIPVDSLLDPPPGRAVCGGNVETSQRVVDVLLGALGLAAASQGTMNNLTFGNEGFGYYETVAGGAGATAEGPGAHGVQTHMTNTRITDAEVLEARFPVRLRRFAFRRGSGGAGRHRGGDGLVRELEFLEPVAVSILAESRDRAPFGLDGGNFGAVGQDRVDGQAVSGRSSFSLGPGQRFTLETPGGGGFGSPTEPPTKGASRAGSSRPAGGRRR